MPINLYSSPMKYKNPNTGTYTNIIGISGNPGRGITSIDLNNDYTLTITFSDNTTTTLGPIRGETGVGIASISKTSSSGLVDTYTITYTDTNTTTFTVTNGATPSFSIGTVTEGTTASATITGTDANPVLNLVLPTANKADKVVGATSGNFAALDANGNLTDSGHKHSDYLTEHQNIPVTDVQVDGTSILNNGVANVPVAGENTIGVVKVAFGSQGLYVHSTTKQLIISKASDANVKTGTESMKPIVPSNQHMSTFYGLAKAAGDSTQSSSSNSVGTYTDNAKDAIQQMLGVDSLIAAHETSTATAAHAIGEVFIMNSKLYRATSAIAINDTITVGTNCEVVKASEVFAHDVQVNGTSVMANGVANVPIGGVNIYGVYKVGSDSDYSGIQFDPSGYLKTAPANSTRIKSGTNTYKPIPVSLQHESTFYGLAKAAGSDLASTANITVGTYPAATATAIKTMLQVEEGLRVVRLI